MCDGRRSLRTICLLPAVTFACASLAACGGGGSSSNTPSVPAPTYAYQGATALAPANTTTAAPFGLGAMVNADDVVSLDHDIGQPPRPGSYDKVVPGPDGGSVHISGTIKHDLTGTLKEKYRSYTQQGSGATITMNGWLTLQYNLLQGSETVNVTATFVDLEVTGGGEDLVLTGTIHKTVNNTNSDNTETHKADLLVTDKTTNTQTWMHPLTIAYDGTPNDALNVSRTLSGRLYASNSGYMNVSTVAPLKYDNNAMGPGILDARAGGPIRLNGKGADVLLTPMNPSYASVGLDTNGDGQVDSGDLYAWSTLAPYVDKGVSSHPVADAKDYQLVPAGAPVTLDGRMSRSDGGGFLTYHWSLIYAPPGSQAAFADPNEATLKFSPDEQGDYLLELTVTDAQGNVAHGYVKFNYPQASAGTTVRIGADDAGPDETAQIGSRVQLDGSLSVPNQSIVSYSWTLGTPPGSQATLVNPDTVDPSFTPDVPGIYSVGLTTWENGSWSAGAGKLVAVGNNPVHLETATMLTGQGMNVYFEDAAMGDLNDDGNPDLVISNSDKTSVYYGKSNGLFEAPVVVTTFLAYEATIGDVNNDGRNDLVLSNDDVSSSSGAPGNVLVCLQQADGTLGSGSLWNYTDNSTNPAYYLGQPVITRLFGQPWNSLWMPESPPRYHVFDLGGDGNAAPQAAFSFANSYYTNNIDYVLADINGDGMKDLAFEATPSGSIDNYLVVSLATPSGTFLAPAAYTARYGGLSAADLNGDGRQDLLLLHAYSSPATLGIRYGQADGSLSAPVDYTFASSDSGTGGPWLASPPGTSERALLFTYQDSGLGDYLSWFPINPDGSLGTQSRYPFGASYLPDSLLYAGDLNHDGLSDLVLGSAFSGDVTFFFGTPWPAKAGSPAAGSGALYRARYVRRRTDASLLTGVGDALGNPGSRTN